MSFSEGDTITLTLVPPKGVLKSTSDPNVASYTNTDMDINVTSLHQVHGHLDGPKSQAASLLVLCFDLRSHSKGRIFKYFAPILTFRRSSNSPADDDPWIEYRMHEPGAGGTEYICEVQSQKSTSSSTQASLSLQPPAPIPVSGTLSYTGSESETFTEYYRYTLSSGLRKDGPHTHRDCCEKVYWKAEQELRVASGINVLQVAILVGRKDDRDFEMVIGLEDAHVDFRYSFTEDVKELFGITTKRVVPIEINPKKPKTPVKPLPTGVERDYLGKLRDDNRKNLKALTYVHMPKLREEKNTS